MPRLGKVVTAAQKGVQWRLVDDFTDGDYTANPAWSDFPSGGWSVSGQKLIATSPSGKITGQDAPANRMVQTGSWAVRMDRTSGYAQFAFVGRPGGFGINPPNTNGAFWIRVDGSTLYLYRGDSGTCETCPPTDVLLTSVAFTAAAGDVFRMDRVGSSGLMHVYANGVLKITHTDSPSGSATVFGITMYASGSSTFDDIYYNPDPAAGPSPIG